MEQFWLGILISVLLGLLAYFGNKWFVRTEKDLDKLRSQNSQIRTEIGGIKDDIRHTKIELKQEIKDSPIQRSILAKVSSLEISKNEIKEQLEIFKENGREDYGRIIHLESKQDSADKQINTLVKLMEKVLRERQRK